MEFLIPFLMFLFAFNTSPTLATNVRTSRLKRIVTQQCQQWCANTGPQAEINMTPIEQIMDRKIKKAVQMITRSSCVLASSDSGGVFKLIIPEVGVRNVFCDVTDDGGDWTVFQRRMNGNVDFYRGWDDYVNGFGELQGDHWLGLEALHQMTKGGNMEMKIKMITKDGVYWVAKYSDFRIGPRSGNYRLHVSGYSGNATHDGFSYHNNRQFSTKDAGHDGFNCASNNEGGWWYDLCAQSNLNGNFNKTGQKGFWWWSTRHRDRFFLVFLHYSEMKFRKRL